MFTSQDRMTALRLSDLFGLVRVAVGEYTGTYPALKTDWMPSDIVDVDNWNRMIGLIKKYGEPFIPQEINYSSTWQNLNNIELAAYRMRQKKGKIKDQIPFNLTDRNEVQL